MEEAFIARFFFSLFISFACLNEVPLVLLLPRFCYAEILRLALFVLWLRWSLYQSIIVVAFPHAHSSLVPSCRGVLLDCCLSETLHPLCFLTSIKNTLKPEQTTLFYSSLNSSKPLRVSPAVSCLQLECHKSTYLSSAVSSMFKENFG